MTWPKKGRREPDDASVWTTGTERMVFKKAEEHSSKGSVWTNGTRNMIRSQACEIVLNTAWQEAAERWVDCVRWRRRQPRMDHLVGAQHTTGGNWDRVA